MLEHLQCQDAAGPGQVLPIQAGPQPTTTGAGKLPAGCTPPAPRLQHNSIHSAHSAAGPAQPGGAAAQRGALFTAARSGRPWAGVRLAPRQPLHPAVVRVRVCGEPGAGGAAAGRLPCGGGLPPLSSAGDRGTSCHGAHGRLPARRLWRRPPHAAGGRAVHRGQRQGGGQGADGAHQVPCRV